MVAYLVNQIVLSKLTYKGVIKARSDLLTKIDAYINEKGLSIDKSV